MAIDANKKRLGACEMSESKLRMFGDWCLTWDRASHVVHLSRGYYRIDLYGRPEIDGYGLPARSFELSVYATNRKDATNRAKLLVSGGYDVQLFQHRLF